MKRVLIALVLVLMTLNLSFASDTERIGIIVPIFNSFEPAFDIKYKSVGASTFSEMTEGQVITVGYYDVMNSSVSGFDASIPAGSVTFQISDMSKSKGPNSFTISLKVTKAYYYDSNNVLNYSRQILRYRKFSFVDIAGSLGEIPSNGYAAASSTSPGVSCTDSDGVTYTYKYDPLYDSAEYEKIGYIDGGKVTISYPDSSTLIDRSSNPKIICNFVISWESSASTNLTTTTYTAPVTVNFSIT